MKKSMLILLAGLAVAAGARDADALRAMVARQADVLEVAQGCLPGSVIVAGAEAVPLAFGRCNGVKAPVVAASSLGRGRAVAYSHEGFFGAGVANRRENAVFLRECLTWLAGGKTPAVVHVDVRRREMNAAVVRAMKGVKDFRVVPLKNYGELEALPAGSVVVTSPDGHSLAEAEKLTAFIRKGGGAMCSVVGWGWHQISGGKSFRTESPFNRALGPAGIYTDGHLVAQGHGGGYEVARDADFPGLSADDALELVEAGASLPNALGARCLYTLGALAEVLPDDETQYRPRLEKLARLAVRDYVPSPELALTTTRVRERLAYLLFQLQWLSEPAKTWPASPAAASYPGVPAKGTVRETRDLEVDLAVPRWHGTGLFAVAGEPLTVKLPEGAEKLGLRVRVGSTTCRLTAHERWHRAPVVDVELPLNQTETVFSSPFGGMVYIVVPKGANGKVAVKVGPACPAAWYVEGRDNADTWLKSLRSCPAPFAEIENDHVAISVPVKYVQNLRDPAPLLQVWREIMDNSAKLTGLPTTRTSPERIVGDVQLCAGYMHAGYPIMVPTGCLRNLMSERIIRAGEQDDVWGFFHEMGHNHQNPDWTFAGTGEVTVNFFTLYNMQKICGRNIRQTKMGNENLARRVAEWEQAGRPLKPWMNDPFLALDFFAKLIEKYGWESFEKLFAEYRTIPAAERPKTDQEKREQWCRRLSRIVGRDLSAEFRFLGVKPPPAPPAEKK